jgi:hypothetical protein
LLLALLVIGGPIASTYAGQTAYASGMQSARAQSMAWHRVPALILRVKPIAMLRQHPARTGPATLSVRWTTPQGSPRTGEMVGRADAALREHLDTYAARQHRAHVHRPARRREEARQLSQGFRLV